MTDVVKRFNYVGDDAQMIAEPDGEFVRYSDYDALCQTVRALRADLAQAQANKVRYFKCVSCACGRDSWHRKESK